MRRRISDALSMAAALSSHQYSIGLSTACDVRVIVVDVSKHPSPERDQSKRLPRVQRLHTTLSTPERGRPPAHDDAEFALEAPTGSSSARRRCRSTAQRL
ncbi:hypothetical protein CC78DRAFT_573339 [Lojkania enalia]|uniref:Uncharacterized protein n=1 Tax=Lojkania enalia TaxID=147567 RepID=A0A9P4ND02_9PLEO|nr:hypothetical protein CC78DRAFT_573339 [Didymosphaeria enalia]